MNTINKIIKTQKIENYIESKTAAFSLKEANINIINLIADEYKMSKSKALTFLVETGLKTLLNKDLDKEVNLSKVSTFYQDVLGKK